MGTAASDLLPARPGSFDPTLEMPAITVEPDLRSTFAGWSNPSRGRLTSLRARVASVWSGTTRWAKRLVVGAAALAAIQLGALAIVHLVGSAERDLDHSPSVAAPVPPSASVIPTTTAIPTTTTVVPTTSTLPVEPAAPESGPAVAVAIPAAWVTPSESSRLRDGMTYEQIVTIVGSPGFRSDVSGRGDGVDYLDNPALNAEYQQTRSTVPWETWQWPKEDLSDQSVALWVTFRAGRAVEIDTE
jgi:hypothetical protein